MNQKISSYRGATRRPIRWPRQPVFAVVFALLLLTTGCMVGPNYKRPVAPVPPAFKEGPPDGWKEAQPNDTALKGKWWEGYNDPKLNDLEEQVVISNQNVLA